MSSAPAPVAGSNEKMPPARRGKGLIRLLICGSVDDGKSTLISRLQYVSNLILEDRLAADAADSKKLGTQGDNLYSALLKDGFTAERNNELAIDVAYRFFSTERREYIVADTPGHEQSTRSIIAGASTADAAVILVDARTGLQTQTRRHSFLVSLMGVRDVTFAINKMDLEGHAEKHFRLIEEDCRRLAQKAGIPNVTAIPISALNGDNVVTPSGNMPWYVGSTLMGYLEGLSVDNNRLQALPFRFPVQWVNRANVNFSGYAGTIASGSIRPGDHVRVHPSGRESTVARIISQDGDLPEAVARQSLTLTLSDEIDISRGDVIAKADAPAEVADQFETTIIWVDNEPMLGGRRYLMKIGSNTVIATPAAPKYKLDVNTFEHIATRTLAQNEIGVCNLALERAIAFDPYRENRDMGSFVLIDRISNRTTCAGMINFALRRAHNITVQAIYVDREARSGLKGQMPCLVWLTGLSGAGKSTIANLLDGKLHAMGRHAYVLDGDNIRHGLNRDLGFTDADRVENIRRVAEVAKLMMDAGLIVIVSLISPFRNERRMARELLGKSEFIEVFVDTPLELAEQRDPKGLYKKARRGDLKNFTGIDSPYETPERPEIHIETRLVDADAAAEKILRHLANGGFVQRA